MTNKFETNDLGVADVTSNGLVLSQSHYIEKVLTKFDKYNEGLVKSPVDVNLHLAKNNG